MVKYDGEGLSLEAYFLRYAFPCTFIIRQRGDIDEKTFRYLESCALDGKKASRRLLASTYKKAFERLRKVAKSMGKDEFWTFEVVREYFINRHNEFIDKRDGSYATMPQILREMCRVLRAKIIDKKDDFFVVTYKIGRKDRTRVVGSHYVPRAQIGESVMIHHGYAVEIAFP